MEGLSNFRYIPARPLSDKTLNNFSSLMQIGVQVPTTSVMLPSRSYLSVKLRVAAFATGIVTSPIIVNLPTFGIANNGNDRVSGTSLALSSNPIGCLFNKASLRINDTTVSSVEEYAGLCKLATYTSETKSSISTVLSTEPTYVFDNKRVDPIGVNAPVVTGTSDYIPAIDVWGNTSPYRISKHSKWQQEGTRQPWSLASRFRLAHKVMLAPFQSEQHLPPGANLLLQMNIDNNWRQRIISGLNGAGVSWVVTGTFPPVLNQVAIEVQDIVLMTCLVDVSLSVPKSISVRYSQFFATTQALNTSSQQNLQFRLPPGTESIYLAFYNGLAGTHTAHSPTDFSINDIILNLQQIDIISGGVSYPYTYYNIIDFGGSQGVITTVNGEPSTPLLLDSQSVPGALSRLTPGTITTAYGGGLGLNTDMDDVTRAYMDYLHGTDSTMDSNGAPMTLSEWQYNSIFAHKLVTPANDRTQDISVRLKFRGGLTTQSIQMLMVAKYSNMVHMAFENGVVSAVTVDNLA